MSVQIVASPVYLDTSALAKLYVEEPESAELEAVLLGRQDIVISDLVVTELASLVARRVRLRQMTMTEARVVHRAVLRNVSRGEVRCVELTRSTHREAERLLLTLGVSRPLRAADAQHLALATVAGAQALVTFDRALLNAAATMGAFELPSPG